MNVYRVSYECNGHCCIGDTVVAQNEEEIREIIANRENGGKYRIENLKWDIKSVESTRIRDLTAGDLIRLLSDIV